ncbi:Exosome complex component RRP40 [Armadillidium vulgare]|nr:Exosome complex component RRP40 [Armadillidium vulgare]
MILVSKHKIPMISIPPIGLDTVLRIVLPGDLVSEASSNSNTLKVFLGPGLRFSNNEVRATRAGLLKKEGKNLYYVETMQKRYVPQRREFVVGIVTKKKGDIYLIDIGGHEPATISYLAFENASKKTKKELKLGDLVYGQLLVASKDMEPEMVCIDIYNRAVGMGILPEGGFLFTIPLHVARSIINPKNPFLLEIARHISYSIVVGFNGRVYVKAGRRAEMVAIMHAIQLLEETNLEEATSSLSKLIDSFLLNYVS